MDDLRERVLRDYKPDPATGCWMWTGGRNQDGYGRFFRLEGGRQRQYRAHRVSYEVHCGPIPEGMFVCHRCDTPACVNPDHLFLGTPKDNVVDMIEKGRRGTPKQRLSDEAYAHIMRRELLSREYAALYGVSEAHVRCLWIGRHKRAA
jgi:hypothetical protein